MILRFRIATPSNTGSPDYTICGQASPVTDHTDLAVSVNIDGEVIWSTSDLDTPAFPTSVTTAANGILIDNFTIEDNEWVVMEIHLTNVWDSTTMILNVSKDGYLSYSNIFEIYGYDLGNNPNQTNTHAEDIDYNPDFTIYLLTETDNVVNGLQTKAFSSYIAYRKPLTQEIYFYCSNSGTYDNYQYIVDNEDDDVICTTRNGMICSENAADFKLTVTIQRYVSGVLTTISTCSTAFATIDSIQMIPDFSVAVTCSQEGIITPDDLGYSIGAVTCSNLLGTNTAKTFIDFTTATVFYVSDTKEYPCQEQRITYALYNYAGVLQKSKVVELDISAYPYTYDPNHVDNIYVFSIDEIGDHILKVTVGCTLDETTNAYQCYENVAIHNSNFFVITEDEACGSYIIDNRSAEDLTFDIYYMDEEGEFILDESILVEALSTHTKSHSTDNIYKYTLIRNLTENNAYNIFVDGDTPYEYTNIIANYCSLKTCIFSYLNKLICNPEDNTCCSDCKQEDYTNFNALIVTALTYFGRLQNEYVHNYLYTALTPNKLDELYTLKTFLDRFIEYCDECTLNKTNCGCS